MSHVEDTNYQYQRRINAVVAGTVLPAPHCAVIAKVSCADSAYLPVIGFYSYLHPAPDIPQPILYNLTDVPPPRPPVGTCLWHVDPRKTQPGTASSHPPSTKRAATSAAKSQNGDKPNQRTLTYCPRISPRQKA
ncbi:MAG: hypothetical protein OSJ26_06540 [Muribaculaceae bacterium]|nr:hypothetical protein [Muribaculaceae bacterium]